MNYSRFLNPISLARTPSPIRVITEILAKSPPSVISLAGGLPNPALFPYESAEFKLKDGTSLCLDKTKMQKALQYGATPGQAELISWLKDMQKQYHDPPTWSRPAEEGGFDLLVTPGCADGICKTFEMLVNGGDNVLIDQPTYPGTLAALRPLGCNLLPVETDAHGMKPCSLRRVMDKWKPSDAEREDSDIPKILYTIPNGVNPTGSTLSLDRKQQIYEIARNYNLLILEDDPYYFLTYNETLPSLLSMDEDGRVIRFDSFSKILSSGLRVGFTSGPSPLIRRIVYHLMVSSIHAASMSQMMVSELLEKWGMEGFEKHVNSVREFYRGQKEAICASAKKHLTGLAEWHEPTAGMFLWLKIHGIEDTKKLIEEKALKKEVMFVPGYAFMPDKDKPSPYLRASFSLASPENMDKGLERLAALIKEELQEKK